MWKTRWLRPMRAALVAAVVVGGAPNDTPAQSATPAVTAPTPAAATVRVVKAVTDLNGGSLLPGDVLEYEITVSNDGPGIIEHLALVDQIPANTVYLPGSLAIASGPGAGSKTDAPGDDQGHFSSNPPRVRVGLGTGATPTVGGVLLAGTSTAVRFRVTVNATVAHLTLISNQAVVEFVDRDTGAAAVIRSTPPNGPPGGTPTVIRVEIPDLTLTKTHDAPFVRGAQGTYTLTVTGSSIGYTAGPITVTDAVPPGLTPVAASGSGWACGISGQTVTCTTSAVVGPGMSAAPILLTVAVDPAAPDQVTNTAVVAGGSEAPASNNSASDLTLIANPAADLSLTKTATAPFTVGVPGSYQLTVRNESAVAAAGPISLTDLLPAGLAFASATGPGWTCTASGAVVTCTNPGPLAPQTASTLTLHVTVLGAAYPSVTNYAQLTTPGDPNPDNDSSSTTTPVGSGIDLAMTKSAGPLTVGATGTYTLTVRNLGTAPTRGPIVVTDTLPAGLSALSASGAGFACSVQNPIVTCLRAAPLLPGQSVAVVVTVAVGAAALHSVVNTAVVGTPDDTDPGNDSDTTTDTPVMPTAPDIAVAKTVLAPLVAGGTGTFRITVTNVGGAPTTGAITLTDVLQSGVSLVSATGSGWSCTSSLQTVSCVHAASLAPQAQATVDLVVAVAPWTTTVSNTVTVATPGDPNPTNDTSTVGPIQTGQRPDLALTKTTSASFVAGQPLTYVFTVRNIGSAPAPGPIVVTDVLPSGLTYLGSAGAGWTCVANGQAVQCSHAGPLAPGGSLTLQLTVATSAGLGGAITNSAQVNAPGDGNPGNDGDTVVTPAEQHIDLAVGKQGPDSVLAGSTATYQLTVRNVGTLATTDRITVTDTLPSGLTYTGATGGGFSCAAAGQVITCTRDTPPLAAGDSAVIMVTVAVSPTPGGELRNVACVRTPGDGHYANDCGSKTSTWVGSVNLELIKVMNGGAQVGDTAVFTLTVRNTGNAPALPPITLVDTLPAGLTFLYATGAGWQCGVNGAVVECTRDTPLGPKESTIVVIRAVLGAAAMPLVANCADVHGVNETGPLGDNRSCSERPVFGIGRLEIVKTVTRPQAEIGDEIGYVITVRNTGDAALPDVQVVDVLPPGFLLDARSVRVDGSASSKVSGAPGPRITIVLGPLGVGATAVVTYRVRVGPGAQLGDNLNLAIAESPSTDVSTAPARARVRVVGGVFDERGVITGKVYLHCDCDNDRVQGPDAIGIPGVRVYLEDGTAAITDGEGKYNFVHVSSRLHTVRVDRTSLPPGSVLVPLGTRNAGDPYSRFVDLKAGELHRADFAEGSRSRAVLEHVLQRRRAGEVHNAGAPAVSPTYPESAPMSDTLRGERRAAADLRRSDGFQGVSMYAQPPLAPRGTTGGDTQPFIPLILGSVLTDRASSLPRAPYLAPSANDSLQLVMHTATATLMADGQSLVPVYVLLSNRAGDLVSASRRVTLEASLGRWLDDDRDPVEPGLQVDMSGGRATAMLVVPPTPGRGALRATTDGMSVSTPVLFAPSMRDLFLSGMVHARVEFRDLVRGGLGLAAGDRFEEELRDWSFDARDGKVTGGGRAALLLKGTVLNDGLLALAFDSERDRGRTFFRDIRPDEGYQVFGDASLREFDAQSRRRFYARLDKGANYSLFGDFQTARADDRRLLSSYDRSLTGAVQHFENDRATATLHASQGRISQVVDELPGRGISGPYALTGTTGLVNSERVEILVRDRHQPSVVLSRTVMTRFADYTIEAGTGRLIFRAPVPSADANLNPVSIRISYESEDAASDAFWIYGFDASVKPMSGLEIGGTFARDESPTSGHRLFGINATARLGSATLLLGEWARGEFTGSRGDAQRVELRHQSPGLEGRIFAITSDRDFANPSSAFAGGRTELGTRFSAVFDDRTRLIGEAIRTESETFDTRRDGALLGIERRLSDALRAEIGYRYAHESGTGLPPAGLGAPEDRDVSAFRGRVTWTLPDAARTALFAEYEQDVRSSDEHRAAVGGEYRVGSRARFHARHEWLSAFEGPYALNRREDQSYTVVGIDADYLQNAQVFSEYRARGAFAGRDTEAAIGLRNRWAVAPGLTLHTSFERVSPLGGAATVADNDALAITGAVEWTRPETWKSTARVEMRNADTGDNLLASFGYARKLSRDLTFLGRTLWDNFDAARLETRGFTQAGLAWRQTDANRWNALLRYEHRYERLGATGTADPDRDVAHIGAAIVNYQPVTRLTFSGRYAAKYSTHTTNGLASDHATQLLMGRGVVDLSSRLDAGLIGSLLFSEGLSDRKYGLGGEIGLILMRNLRIAGGYNLFGFTDRHLDAFGTTRRGPYLELGFKFDETLFPGSSAPRTGGSED